MRDGQLLTNDERHSIMLGITRDSVLQIARTWLSVEIRPAVGRLTFRERSVLHWDRG